MATDPLSTAESVYIKGQLDAAKDAYETALAAGSDKSQCELGLGLIAIDQEKPGTAITHLKAAVAANPGNVKALTALGAAFNLSNLPAKAATILLETVRRVPHVLEPRLHLARAFAALQRFDDALAVLNEGLDTFESEPEIWRLKGKVEREAGRLKSAQESFARLCELEPTGAGALNDLGVTCRALGRFEEAEQHYRNALARDPKLAVAHANLGNVLEVQGDLEAALPPLESAVSLDRDSADFAYNLAAVLSKLERPDEAIPHLERVTSLAPERWDAWTNLGVARLDCGDLSGSETALRHALEINSDNPEAHYNLAWLLLLTDHHREGWSELEWRWQLADFSSELRTFDCPAWDGQPLDGKTLLLHAEQGFGDTIQFCRFAADIKKQAGRVILECQPALVSLLESLLESLPGVDQVIARGDQLPPVDVHAPLLSLPNLTGYDGQRTQLSAAYLQAGTTRFATLNVPENKERRIGLVWAGSPDNKIERRRHIDIDMFLNLFGSTDADFVSLQVGPRRAEVNSLPSDRLVFDCADHIKDFADTAAVIDQLDLVIGVDTAVMHLAGAMGKPAWLLLPYMPDYRWGLGRSTTPWYDSMRLFRQPHRGDWSAVFTDLCAALRSW